MTAKQAKRARKKENQQAARREGAQAILEYWAPTVAAAAANHETHLELDVSCCDCPYCQDETSANSWFFAEQDTPEPLWPGPRGAILQV